MLKHSIECMELSLVLDIFRITFIILHTSTDQHIIDSVKNSCTYQKHIYLPEPTIIASCEICF